jgi:hypothetical protein
MLRKILIACVVIGMVCVASFPVNAGEAETTAFHSLDNTLWESKNDILWGAQHMGFYEDTVYLCFMADECLSCEPVGTNYRDLGMISFFHVVIPDNKISYDIRGVLSPRLAKGFIKRDHRGCNFTRMIRFDWNPDVSVCDD